MKVLARLSVWFLLLFMAFGFRLGWKNVMSASKSSPDVYIKLCDQLMTHTLDENSVDASDELAGQYNLNGMNVVFSITKDYNQIESSYLNLLIQGDTDGDGDIDGSDTTAHDGAAENKIIELCAGSTGGINAGGVSEVKPDGGCTIKLATDVYKDVKTFLRIVTHEVGHCLGLDHAHAMNKLSIMSYFSGADIYRLKIDDKMGITFLYPNETIKEKSTLGLSCSAR